MGSEEPACWVTSLDDGLAVPGEHLSNAWWHQPGHAHPWDSFVRLGASCWGSNWAEEVGTKQALLPSRPARISPGWSRAEEPGSDAPRLPPARRPFSSARCRRCQAGLILVQIRCVRLFSDNSPFLKAGSGDCGKYVALIDC